MDPQICYICAMTSVFYSRNLFKTKSKYSETRIYDFVCKFLGKIPSVRRQQQQQQASNSTNVDNDDCVCIECLGKIDEYDLATITAQRVESELRGLLLHAESLLNPKAKVILAGECGVDVATNDNIDHFASSIETIEMLDQFKSENSYNESIEPNDSIESVLANDDYDDASLASGSDEEYHPYKDLKKKSHKTAIKTKRKAENTRELKQQNSSNSHLVQQKSIKCVVCNMEFKSVAALARHKHIRSDSSGTKSNSTTSASYKCSSCSEILCTKAQYDTHLKQHKEDLQFKCTICGFDLKEKSALDEHNQLHADVLPLQCVLCKKEFKQKGALVRHMRIHSGLHFYQCHRCGKGFVHKSSFEMHLMAHDDIRKKQCPHCTQMFRSTSHLNRHLRIHTGSKPYSCPVCSQKFAQRYNMNVHLRLHDTSANRQKSDKTHICKFCNSAFARQSKLEEHLKKNHEAAIPHTSIGNNLNNTISEK